MTHSEWIKQVDAEISALTGGNDSRSFEAKYAEMHLSGMDPVTAARAIVTDPTVGKFLLS